MKIHIYLSVLILLSCGRQETMLDASGVFEATEVVVSSEANGKILSLDVSEGDKVEAKQSLGLIDTTQFFLKKQQLKSSKVAILAGKPDIPSQISATEQEIMKWQREKKRVENLLKGDVATQKQLDDINAQLAILQSRLKAQKSSLTTNTTSIDTQSETIDVQIAQVTDQIERSSISSPISGTILSKYAETGEFAMAGRPLLKIGDLEHMILRAYITADKLTALQLGQEVTVLAEFGEEETREYTGTLTWISDVSEFTPKTIQTQDERANLVYAIKIRVANDGYLKIGMYGGITM